MCRGALAAYVLLPRSYNEERKRCYCTFTLLLVMISVYFSETDLHDLSHLAGRPAKPVVRVRISKTGKPRFLLNALSGNGANCLKMRLSNGHRYQGPCKHGIVAWVLWWASLHQDAVLPVGRSLFL